MRFTFHLEWFKCVQVKRSGSSHPVVQAHSLNTELNVGTRFLLEAPSATGSIGTRGFKAAGLANYATFFNDETTSATVAPISDGVGAMKTPQFFRISTFSGADSPNAEIIAPA